MTTYTPNEASRLLDVPGSTLRRWAKRFSHRLSEGAQRRKRIYDEQDLDTFAAIRDLAAKNFTLDQIDARLGELVHQPGNREQRSLTLPGVLREINGLHGEIDDLRQSHADMRRRLDELERESKRSLLDRLLGRK